MKTIEQILKSLGNPQHCRIESQGFMPLSIERIGRGPNDLPAVSVCHYGEQNGDLMRDPEVCFEVAADGRWHPYYYRNDYAGYEQEVYFTSEGGQQMIRLHVKRDLQSFARLWNRNIREQGFVEAAKEQLAAA
jgi:hypothetical protein